MSDIKEKTLKLIDGLKATCQSYGMGNDGNEYKIITQVFLYKFLNDKFGYELKNAKSGIAKKLTGDVKWETAYETLSDDERMLIQSAISPDVPMLEPYHLIANLWNQQGKGDFDTIFDSTMTDIAAVLFWFTVTFVFSYRNGIGISLLTIRFILWNMRYTDN